ncbi:AF1514 family protein [Desulfatiglans anilini]|uniref:AF1514 family protein n=1 Tax=Desulfatiglans anilini TaxID=90728 RepID=UPI0003F6AD7A|nr:AF1514 family protein [Desulfatiglans anilini]
MESCRALTHEMLPNRMSLDLEDSPRDLKTARLLADQKAQEVLSEPMLLAWYERDTGRFSPQVECCGEDKPSWVIYAESRGADLSVDINRRAFVFIYHDAGKAL